MQLVFRRLNLGRALLKAGKIDEAIEDRRNPSAEGCLAKAAKSLGGKPRFVERALVPATSPLLGTLFLRSHECERGSQTARPTRS